MQWEQLAALAYGVVGGLVGSVALRRRAGPRGYVAAVLAGLVALALAYVTRDVISDDGRRLLATFILVGVVAAVALGGVALAVFQARGRHHNLG